MIQPVLFLSLIFTMYIPYVSLTPHQPFLPYHLSRNLTFTFLKYLLEIVYLSQKLQSRSSMQLLHTFALLTWILRFSQASKIKSHVSKHPDSVKIILKFYHSFLKGN